MLKTILAGLTVTALAAFLLAASDRKATALPVMHPQLTQHIAYRHHHRHHHHRHHHHG